MVGSRVPIVAAVNGAAVGLGCSLVALSDIVYMAESTHLADPHVLMGLVAADGGPVTWPLLMSLQLAKEYALTGDRIPARRAAEIGLVNHVCPDDEVLDQAMACAHRIARLPKGAVEDTKRVINIQLERAVLASLDFALSAEDRSFRSPELRANLDERLRPDRSGVDVELGNRAATSKREPHQISPLAPSTTRRFGTEAKPRTSHSNRPRRAPKLCQPSVARASLNVFEGRITAAANASSGR